MRAEEHALDPSTKNAGAGGTLGFTLAFMVSTGFPGAQEALCSPAVSPGPGLRAPTLEPLNQANAASAQDLSLHTRLLLRLPQSSSPPSWGRNRPAHVCRLLSSRAGGCGLHAVTSVNCGGRELGSAQNSGEQGVRSKGELQI